MLLPDAFIPLAEESGVILPIGAWILERACRTPGPGRRGTTCRGSSSRSTCPLASSGIRSLDEQITAALAASGLDPEPLVLEITESVLMQTGAATVDRLTELRRLGIRLALDDFGTGYSSLSYLERFPVDILKIDKSFVERMGEKGFKPVIARAVAQLGKGLGLEVVAEGIERPAQAAALLRLGCMLRPGQRCMPSRFPPDDVEVVLHRGRVDLPAGSRRGVEADPDPAPAARHRLRLSPSRRTRRRHAAGPGRPSGSRSRSPLPRRPSR